MRVPFTFTRPGSGWVMNEQGIYVERGVDEPRYQWTPDGRSEGLLVERQLTYGVNDNSTPGQTNWPNLIVEGHSDPYYPDALLLTPTVNTVGGSAGGTWFAFGEEYPFGSGADDLPYVRKVLVKRGFARYFALGMTNPSGTGSGIFMDLDTMTPIHEHEQARFRLLAGDWVELAIVTVAVGASSKRMRCHFGNSLDDGRIVLSEDAPAVVALPFMAQTDNLDVTPMRTTGAQVTRPADTLYADMSLVEGFNPTKGTIVLEARSFEAIGSIMSLSDALTSPLNRLFMTRTSTGYIRFQVRAQSENSPFTWPDIPEFDVYRLAIAYDSHSARIRFNGGSTEYATTPTANAIQGLRYLRLYSGGHGLIRHVQYIPQAVSDAELQQLSSLT